MQKAARWLCGICSRGVDSNSIQCTSCQKEVHKKCSGIKDSMYKVTKSFICRGCLNPVTSRGHTCVSIGASANLELVHKFFSERQLNSRSHSLYAVAGPFIVSSVCNDRAP